MIAFNWVTGSDGHDDLALAVDAHMVRDLPARGAEHFLVLAYPCNRDLVVDLGLFLEISNQLKIQVLELFDDLGNLTALLGRRQLCHLDRRTGWQEVVGVGSQALAAIVQADTHTRWL